MPGFSFMKSDRISSITVTFSGSYLFPKKVIVVTFSLGISKLTTLFPVPQPPSIRALAKNTAYSPTILLPIPYPLFESVKPANNLSPTLSTYILA